MNTMNIVAHICFVIDIDGSGSFLYLTDTNRSTQDDNKLRAYYHMSVRAYALDAPVAITQSILLSSSKLQDGYIRTYERRGRYEHTYL